MFTWVLDLVISFILLGLVEVLIKPAAAYWVRRKLIRWTPLVLVYVDQVFPDLMAGNSSEDLEKLVRAKFSELTGTDWSDTDLDYFWKLYDPRVTLKKLHKFNLIN
jgi:hypothetical protein